MKAWIALVAPAVIVFALDQVAKSWIRANVALGEVLTPIEPLREVFGVTFSQNTGAAFSLLPQAGDLFLLIAIAMIIGIVVFHQRIAGEQSLARLALGLVLGGTCGNAFDRLTLGYVVDWFLVRIPNVIANVSNFADHAIVLGIGTLFLLSWRARPVKRAQPNDS
ncbi:MAG: signal peptidase II [Anaerolineae bacterium]|nr:signal peptidase II [Anaerolineae bacterium]MDW8299724.1 signal peptidase II [Anaerolineae bacterium]